MKFITAKELKNRTGTVLRRVSSGEKVLITKRGRPCAVLSPAAEDQSLPIGLRSHGEAWEDIEKTLKTTRPHHKTWKEAIQWTRRRG
jgi:prevent-host-death family protein